jgi:hypothetical protein
MKFIDLINEQSPNDPITDKERKKLRTVFMALKTGTFTFEDMWPGKIRYVLKDDFDIERGPRTGRAIIVLLGGVEDVCKIYKVNEDGSNGDYLSFEKHEKFYESIVKRIERKFNQFNVHIIF